MLAATHGGDQVRIVSDAELSLSFRILYTMRSGLRESLLTDQRNVSISNQTTFVIWNRLGLTTPPAFLHSKEQDRQYATMEFHAFLTGWLSSLGDRATPRVFSRGLSDPHYSLLAWNDLARKAGIATLQFEFMSNLRRWNHRGFISFHGDAQAGDGGLWRNIGNRPEIQIEPPGAVRARVLVAGPFMSTIYYDTSGAIPSPGAEGTPPVDANACRRLSRLAGLPILEILFALDPETATWRYLQSSANPTMFQAGDAALVAEYFNKQIRQQAGVRPLQHAQEVN